LRWIDCGRREKQNGEQTSRSLRPNRPAHVKKIESESNHGLSILQGVQQGFSNGLMATQPWHRAYVEFQLRTRTHRILECGRRISHD
jgi:hypothetical protein